MASDFANVINNITKEDLNIINKYEESPELLAVSTENENLVEKIISLPYIYLAKKSEGGLTPLNLALIHDIKKIINILLEKNNIKKMLI